MNILPGSPHPLGAAFDGNGVNFAVFSAHAEGIELCLFDEEGNERRASMTERTEGVWHGYVTGIGPGQRYGYRASGAYEPDQGLRFNPNVVLLDPYARAVDGVERWDAGCFAYVLGGPEEDRRMNPQPALGAPRGVVVDSAFDWVDDQPPRRPLHRTIIYEAHVRGLTKQHPELSEPLRGTYGGVAHPAVIRHLRDLGITAVELMPVHAFVDDKLLLDRGLRNYWGYNSIGYFAPDVRYRSGVALASEVVEFNYTGTGNTLNVRQPQVRSCSSPTTMPSWGASSARDGGASSRGSRPSGTRTARASPIRRTPRRFNLRACAGTSGRKASTRARWRCTRPCWRCARRIRCCARPRGGRCRPRRRVRSCWCAGRRLVRRAFWR